MQERPLCSPTAHLKLEAQCALQLAWIAHRARDDTGLYIADICIGQAELRVVEDVEGFRTELDLPPFANREVFEERHIPVPASGTNQDVSASVAVCIGGRITECSGVEPAIK